MKCPIDGEMLVMTDRSGVEIDYCPKCRGVWLDRGELDKIIERSAAPAPAPAPVERRQERPSMNPMDHFGGRSDYGRPRKKKSESFLGELFDF